LNLNIENNLNLEVKSKPVTPNILNTLNDTRKTDKSGKPLVEKPEKEYLSTKLKREKTLESQNKSFNCINPLNSIASFYSTKFHNNDKNENKYNIDEINLIKQSLEVKEKSVERDVTSQRAISTKNIDDNKLISQSSCKFVY